MWRRSRVSLIRKFLYWYKHRSLKDNNCKSFCVTCAYYENCKSEIEG